MEGSRVGLSTSSGAQAWQHREDASTCPAPRRHREGPGDVQEGPGEGITGGCSCQMFKRNWNDHMLLLTEIFRYKKRKGLCS